MKSRLTVLFMLLFTAVMSYAQVKTPAASPTGSSSQDVGLMTINIEYSRPSMKGRDIFGDLVPYDKIWRTGANASTKVEFTGDVMIGDQKLPAGKYALYTIPGLKEWTIIFHKNLEHWGTGDYDESEDALRYSTPALVSDVPIETFTIGVMNITKNGAHIELAWDDTRVLVPVTTDTDAAVFASIDETMAGTPTAGDYVSAATYYMEAGKDLDKALDWFNKGIAMDGEKFWILRRKSLLQAKMGDKTGAITTAKRSLELAKEAGNDDYVRMNTASLKEWGM